MDKGKNLRMAGKNYILALDQGTSSSRAVLFDQNFAIHQISQYETVSKHPHLGWVEQDAMEILNTQLSAAKDAVIKSKIDIESIAAIGITNQRETTIVWDKNGKPVCPAIIWQDTRTDNVCKKMQQDGLEEYVIQKTGLLINPYFSATKLAWILENVKNARKMAEKGDLLFGNVDSWLIWNLTNGKLHITDYSNASRTMLYNIEDLKWDEKLLHYFKIPPQILPEVRPSSEVFGYTDLLGKEIPVAGTAGDQQAALFGQKCIKKGMAKNTYGTGCFLLMNTGTEKILSKNRLLSTIAWGIDDKITYALEGSVFMGGAIIKWLRDDLKIIDNAAESEIFANSLHSNDGVYFVPAFNGLGAPHWDTSATGTICGMKSGCNKSHIIRAALEAMAFQTRDVITAMEKDAAVNMRELHVDGGAAANNFLMQFQADILGSKVIRPQILETTALGAAMLAAKAVGLSVESSRSNSGQNCNAFSPKISTIKRIELCTGWNTALKKSKLQK